MRNAIIILAILALLAAFAWGKTHRGSSAASVQGALKGGAASALVASEAYYDFGRISMRDGNVSKEFTLTNPTDNDIALEAFFTSCMCTTAYLELPDGQIFGPNGMQGMAANTLPHVVIKPGGSAKVKAVFDPSAHGPAGVGRIERLVYLGDASGGSLELTFSAVVTP